MERATSDKANSEQSTALLHNIQNNDILETDPEQSTDSILVLNDDVLLKILRYLPFDDRLNVAQTCVRLQGIAFWTFAKITKFSFNEQRSKNGINYINRVFDYIGKNLTYLFVLDWTDRTEYILKKCSEKCENLKGLSLKRMYWDYTRCPSLHNFRNIEQLSLEGWDYKSSELFFSDFCNLKVLKLTSGRNQHHNALKICFTRNPNIESVTVLGRFDEQTLKLLPKLKSVCVEISNPLYKFKLLSQLNRMTKLKLCDGLNFMDPYSLDKLSKNASLVELEIFRVRINDYSLKPLRSFKNLQRLVIDSMVCSVSLKWSSTVELPPNLRHLTLVGFEVTTNQISSIINQLQSLQNIFIDSKKIKNHEDTILKNFEKISQDISDATVFGTNQQTVNVILAHLEYSSEKTIIAGRLRFFRHLKYFGQPDVFRVELSTLL